MLSNYSSSFNSQYSHLYYTRLEDLRHTYSSLLTPSERSLYVPRISDLISGKQSIVIVTLVAEIFDRSDSIKKFLNVQLLPMHLYFRVYLKLHLCLKKAISQ